MVELINKMYNCNNSCCEEFFKIISTSAITSVFQPIVSLREGSILGFEALSRGPLDSTLHNPANLFQVAEDCNCLWELELLCRTKALGASDDIFNNNFRNKEKANDVKLFLNVNPNIMNDAKFRNGFTKEYLEEFSIKPENIIFEITERNAVTNYNNFIMTINHYKEQNYKIAIDDAGAGYSGLNLISDLHPHFLKLDMNLIRDIDKDKMKQAIVKSMYEFSKLSNTDLIAEGIETLEELEVLVDIGVHYGQGYFIQKPNSQVKDIDSNIYDIINTLNRKKNHTYGYKISHIQIGDICENTITLSPNMFVAQVDELFSQNHAYHGFCVTQNDIVIGVVTKSLLKSKLSGRYGYSLFSNKSISYIMDRNFLSIDYKTSIDSVAKLAMSRNEESLYDFITITKNSEYFGIVTVKRLIEKTIEIEIVNAKHLNPLTELPGNVLIEQCLEMFISSSEAFSALYFDLDNFKAYNDVYGFESGDKIIKQLSLLMQKSIPKNAFLGHIGGDDFIAVISTYDISEICKNIIQDFDAHVKLCYSKDHVEQGFFISKNRHGIEEIFPLLSLSIAVINNKNGTYDSVYAFSEESSRLKKRCKQIPGSCYLVL